MIIQNFEELAITEKKKDCLEILESGLQAANPENIIRNYVTEKTAVFGGLSRTHAQAILSLTTSIK